LSSVIVAHQGTDPTRFLADLTDLNIRLTNLNSALFPGLSSSIQVHSGFAAEHAKTATTILAAVSRLLARHGSSSVTVTGHSLGAALALLDSVYLPLHLPAGTSVRMVGYGMPRVGNGAFADYVDARLMVTHVNNREDPVPIVPGRFQGFVHPSGEVHIQDSGAWDACPGQDNPSKLCIVGDVPNVFESNIFDHLGPYDDNISMGSC
jgi:predicted lipase